MQYILCCVLLEDIVLFDVLWAQALNVLLHCNKPVGPRVRILSNVENTALNNVLSPLRPCFNSVHSQ